MAEPLSRTEPTPPRREFNFGDGDIGIAQERKPGRTVIEDVVSSDPEKRRFALFDGTKSARAPQAAREFLEGQPVVRTKAQMRQLLGGAHKSVLDTESGGQSTATIVQFFEEDGKIKVVLGNVGDSRAYRWRTGADGKGHLERLTTDDDPLHRVFYKDTDPDEVKAQAKNRADALAKKFDGVEEFNELSKERMPISGTFQDFPVWKGVKDGVDVFVPEDRTEVSELELFMIRHLTTNALGRNRFTLPEIGDINDATDIVDANPGDFFLLFSDGMANLTSDEINDIMTEYSHSPQLAAEKLRDKAVERSGEGKLRSNPDDISAVAIRVPSLTHSQPGSYS